MDKMNILVGCEKSAIVREAFRAKGHNVISCDLQPTEIPGPHYQGDIFDIINDGFDMMVVFPPCTHLAVSGARHFAKKRADGRQQEALNFVKKLMEANIKKISLENPIGIISSEIRQPDQIINPYYFGDPVPKKTCLWLKNLPKLIWRAEDDLFGQKTLVKPEYLIYKSLKTKSGFSHYSIFGKLGKGHGDERSKTFPGIAKAMAEQWG